MGFFDGTSVPGDSQQPNFYGEPPVCTGLQSGLRTLPVLNPLGLVLSLAVVTDGPDIEGAVVGWI